MADLWERLNAAKARATEAAANAPAAGERPAEAASAPEFTDKAPEGWRWVSPLVAEHAAVFELDSGFWDFVGPGVQASDWEQVLCFDTETTGLSGGAGTVAFLVGWARLLPLEGRDPLVEVRQWFLRDLPGESELITAIDNALAEARALVSFNGASFDLPLLRSRWALAGRAFPVLPHRDNLHLSRRFWKRLLDSCRLSRLEEAILGIRRPDDVPGALVPALWFDYLRSGAVADFVTPLAGVLRHHAQDVYSLLCLDLLLRAVELDPGSPRWKASHNPVPKRTPLARLAPDGLLHPDLPAVVAVDFWGILALEPPPTRRLRLESTWH